MYDPRKSSPVTWANTVMRNRCHNLYAASQMNKRKALNVSEQIEDVLDNVYLVDGIQQK